MKTNEDPKIMFLDIEASDLSADIGHIICIGYKWAHEKKPHVMSILDHPGRSPNDDAPLLLKFEPIYAQADLVVYHFGMYYDMPFIQTRRLIHGLKPLAPCSEVDTWKIAKKKLRLGSNRLERILQVLRCPYRKTAVDLGVWSDARVGIRKAIQYVVNHCKWDVLVLEWVYNRIKPIWTQHPALYRSGVDKPTCRLCGSDKVRSLGVRLAQTFKYRRRVCQECGHYFKGEKI